jgi:hypothetical protein
MKMVLSESPYPSNFDVLNNFIVPKYYVSLECSPVCLSCKSLPSNFFQNNKIMNSSILFKGFYEKSFE